MNEYKRAKVCERCGTMFIANAPNCKYCMPCRPLAEAEHNEIYRSEKNRLKRERNAMARAEKRISRTLNEHLADLKTSGKTYAEDQKEKTLAMLPRIIDG